MRNYFISSVFVALLAFSVFLFVADGDTDSVLKENREPAAIPAISSESLLDGSFEEGFGEYVNDNTAYRGKLMTLANKIGALYGYTPKGMGQIISTTSDIGTGAAQESRLVIYNNSIMEVFDAAEETEIKYADTLNTIRKTVPSQTEMYSMLIPTKLAFCDPMYSSVEDSQKDAIDLVYSKLDSDITAVDVFSRLLHASETENSLYYMTDHHWTPDGSYYGYEAFSFAAGKAPKPKTQYEYKENGTFLGSLYLKAKSSIRHQPEDICFYYDTASDGNISIVMRAEDGVTEYGEGSPVFQTSHNDYGIFFGGDNPLIEITNSALPDGETLMIVKDSYANALIPWLINDYKQVIVIDPRSFGGSFGDEIERYKPDKLLMVNYVFSTTFDDYCDILMHLAG